jgi:hypothetical protein
MSDISRKKFLEYTASAGASVLAFLTGKFCFRQTGEKIKSCIIGCGSVSGSYIPKLLTI